MAFQDRIDACNNADLAHYRSLSLNGRRIGWVRHDRIDRVLAFGDVFEAAGNGLAVRSSLSTPAARSAALADVTAALRDTGEINGWRGETYAVAPFFGGPVDFTLERAACPYLGVRCWGFHMTGFVRSTDGMKLWIAERAADKPTYPGMLDNTVAGGQPAALSMAANVVKECAEEASIPADLARHAVPVGALSYLHETAAGLKPDQMMCYDLELPADFTPTPADGEVAAFHLLPVAEVMAIVRDTDRFKFNCALVLIDFFIRHGLLTPDEEPDYAGLCASLNQGSPAGP